ncbi:hypothetical protein CPB85DRAFT_1441729 [Mucidula mucida]|nr:hypothetical protein CPB85DRAFT_1441729 [Mucidula mucida]
MDPQAQARALITALEHMQIVTYFDVASTALLVHEYILTFEQEVTLIWPSAWNITKILYLLTRYLPFVDAVLVLWHQFTPNMPLDQCYLAYKSTGWMFTISFAMAEVILTIRTWAVWNRNRLLTFALPIFYIACWAPDFTFMGIFLDSMRFGVPPIENFQGCLVTAGNPILSWCWILLMIYEGVMLLLMAIKAFGEFRNVHAGTPQLLAGILKDGILYYLYLFVLSTINVVIIRVLPILQHDFANLFSFFERVIHAVLTCRVIINIRVQAKKDLAGSVDTYSVVGDLSTVSAGPMRFRSQHLHTRDDYDEDDIPI